MNLQLKFKILEKMLLEYFEEIYQHQKKIFENLDKDKLLSKLNTHKILSIYKI